MRVSRHILHNIVYKRVNIFMAYTDIDIFGKERKFTHYDYLHMLYSFEKPTRES